MRAALSRRALLLAAILSLLLVAAAFRPVVEGDGVGYASYLQAVLVGRGLDFSRAYAAAEAAGLPSAPNLLHTRTPTGLLANYFPVGPALLSSPLYLGALALRPSGKPPFGAPFAGAFVIASLLYGLLALALCWRLTHSVIAVVGVTACTPYVFYLLTEPSYSHTFSAFAVSLFVYVWWRSRDRRDAAAWLLLGLLGGLMGLVRFEDGVLMVICLLDLPTARWRLLLLAPGALIAFAPQLMVDHVLFNAWLPQRPPDQDLTIQAGHQLQVLFSSWHGLFVWHPITLLAVVGFAVVRDRRLQAACLIAFVVETAINGAAPDWTGGATFGARRFLDLTPFFAVGLAAIAERIPRRLAWSLVTVLAVWNALLLANFDYVIRSGGDPGYLGLVSGQLKALRDLPRLAVQGAVVRDLGAWALVGRPLQVGRGLALLAAEAACVAVAAMVALGPHALQSCLSRTDQR